VVTRTEGRGEWEVTVDMSFLFGVMKIFLELNSGDGCTRDPVLLNYTIKNG
jgi:hypothetical protein